MRSIFFRLTTAVPFLILPAYSQIAVTVSPSTVSLHAGTFYQFSVAVTGTTTTSVAWTVALPAGATGSAGSITTGGRYAPPSALPVPNTVIVTATSNADATVSSRATVTVLNPYPSLASASPSSVSVGAFSLTLNGSGFVPGAVAMFDSTALSTTYVSGTKLIATGTSTKSQKDLNVLLTVKNPDPGSVTSVDVVKIFVGSTSGGSPKATFNAAARLLDQAAFGPDSATVAHVQSIGLPAYLDEQFAADISPYPDPSMTSYGLGQVQARFFTNAVHGQDQLRQRLAFALAQMFVVSAIEENEPRKLVPYLQVLQKDAFGNFLTLMTDVTLSPTMGEYLDMRNNDKADPVRGTLANENYARELLQLFTLGTSLLNQNGTLQFDGAGNPIPTYTQTAVAEFSRVYTGWTYPTKPGAVLQKHNPSYYVGNMQPYETNHDTGSKTLLNGMVLPAGQTATQDLTAALNNIFTHPNAAPFVCLNLIQHLVTSNPSPAYVGRVAAVFNDNGSGVRGDLKAVVKAILLDAEARQGDSGPLVAPDMSGHLREPVFVVSSILRGLGALVNDTNGLTGQATKLGQTIFAPPTVFNYFAPGYHVPSQFTPGQSLLGPEFQLDSPSAAIARANLVSTLLYSSLGAGTVIDLTPFSTLAPTPSSLVNLVSQTFLYGQIPAAMQQQILAAVSGTTGNQARAQAAIYLAVSSAYYNVEH